MPEWSRKGKTEVVNEWDRFISSVSAHERNHRRIYTESYKRLKAIGDIENANSIFKIAQECTDKYDTITDHGALEGARLGFRGNPKDFNNEIKSFMDRIKNAI